MKIEEMDELTYIKDLAIIALAELEIVGHEFTPAQAKLACLVYGDNKLPIYGKLSHKGEH